MNYFRVLAPGQWPGGERFKKRDMGFRIARKDHSMTGRLKSDWFLKRSPPGGSPGAKTRSDECASPW